jgi:hypothetical protein
MKQVYAEAGAGAMLVACHWPVYPRLRRIMQGSERARNARPVGDGRLAWIGALLDGDGAAPRLAFVLVVVAVVAALAWIVATTG